MQNTNSVQEIYYYYFIKYLPYQAGEENPTELFQIILENLDLFHRWWQNVCEISKKSRRLCHLSLWRTRLMCVLEFVDVHLRLLTDSQHKLLTYIYSHVLKRQSPESKGWQVKRKQAWQVC